MTVQWMGPDWLRRPLEFAGLKLYQRSTDLALYGQCFDDSAVGPIIKLRKLKTLTLTNTNLTDEGLSRLRFALPECKIERR